MSFVTYKLLFLEFIVFQGQTTLLFESALSDRRERYKKKKRFWEKLFPEKMYAKDTFNTFSSDHLKKIVITPKSLNKMNVLQKVLDHSSLSE